MYAYNVLISQRAGLKRVNKNARLVLLKGNYSRFYATDLTRTTETCILSPATNTSLVSLRHFYICCRQTQEINCRDITVGEKDKLASKQIARPKY